MITLHETQVAMNELVQPGERNGKQAFYAGCLSIQCPLENNSIRAQVLHQYANKPLPENREVLRSQLYVQGPMGGLPMHSVVNTLYEIEKLWDAGIIHLNAGSTFASQAAWRLAMVSLIPGMGCKTVSFALAIYNAGDVAILTLDRWHFRILGEKADSVPTSKYLKLEQRLMSMCLDVAYASAETDDRYYNPFVVSAWLWENKRIEAGKSSGNGKYQSHAGLSCYIRA